MFLGSWLDYDYIGGFQKRKQCKEPKEPQNEDIVNLKLHIDDICSLPKLHKMYELIQKIIRDIDNFPFDDDEIDPTETEEASYTPHTSWYYIHWL